MSNYLFSFREVQDLRSKCWSGDLSEDDLDRLADLCSFALSEIPYSVFSKD